MAKKTKKTEFPQISDEHLDAEIARRDIVRNKFWMELVQNDFPDVFGTQELRSLMAALQFLMEIPVGAIIEAAYAGERDARNWASDTDDQIPGIRVFTGIGEIPEDILKDLPEELVNLLSKMSRPDA